MDRITLLVADDEPIARAFVRRYVQEENLPVSRVFEAASGGEAVDQAVEHSPDLILLDIRMPGMSGLDAAAAIMEKRPGSHIVVVTAYDEFEYARSALRSGVSDYLLKPLDPRALARHVAAALEARKNAGSRQSPQRAHPLVDMVRRHIDSHLDEVLRLEDIARAVHVSPAHCSRMFSRHAGISISEYTARRRMTRAVELLENTFMSMTEIAGSLGFSSSTYFASWFKHANGISPLQYRKRHEDTLARFTAHSGT